MKPVNSGLLLVFIIKKRDYLGEINLLYIYFLYFIFVLYI